MPAASLHWIIADANEAITVESTESGLHVYDNPVGVLTNNPPFEQQMFQLTITCINHQNNRLTVSQIICNLIHIAEEWVQLECREICLQGQDL